MRGACRRRPQPSADCLPGAIFASELSAHTEDETHPALGLHRNAQTPLSVLAVPRLPLIQFINVNGLQCEADRWLIVQAEQL